MECHHPRSLRLNPSAKGVTATVLGRRDAQGVILVHIPRGQTINSDLHIPTLKTLQKRFRMVGPLRNVAVMFLQLQRTRPHTSLKTREAIAKLGLSFFSHHTAQILLLQMSTSLQPSKMPSVGKRLREMTKLLKTWLRVQNSNWHKKEIDAPVSRWSGLLKFIKIIL